MLLCVLFSVMLIARTTQDDEYGDSKYDVTLYTGSQTFAGTQAKISIQYFGKDDEAVTKELPKDPNKFKLSSVDEFKVDLGKDIGDINKIIVSHDNTGESPGWFLEKVEIQHIGTTSTFIGRRWLQKLPGSNTVLSIDKKEEEECGHSSLIVDNKIESEPNQWPWVVFYKLGTTQCSGTLVHPQWVLTSAQCTMGKESLVGKVRLGEFDLAKNDYTEEEAYSTHVETYPDYYPYSIEGDVALIKLKKPAKLDSYVQIACLPRSQDGLVEEEPCYMAGWGGGNMKKNKFKIMHQLLMAKLSFEICQGEVNKSDENVSVTPNMLCYSTHESIKDCIGDLGSPLMCKTSSDRYTTYGYMSWTDPTCDEKNTIFTNIGKYLDWIEKTIYSKYVFDNLADVNIDSDDIIVHF